ncbi:methyltransferase domain-containing protein [Endozoicomonas sp. YOMI1]|uniref:methyltransferase domain-containing protein n=1 Tax=Endozoicomonas sp. YOMI1 TaxID=2828739 RepID=UPI0021494578|nr:methyltransferase domain-containing protein [Endozoicomonas sp. YOMI1]
MDKTKSQLMPILSFLLGVLLTWLFMSGLMAQGLALLIRIWWPSSNRERELKVDQWLLNNPVQPASGWRLLGYWRDTSQYRQACSEMAGLLADKACLSTQDEVLDVGFTSHDQLLVWLDYYQVQHLTAIASDEQQMVRALEHCGHFNTLKLVRGGDKSLAEQPENSCDKLIGLDCVYHLESRSHFFSHVRKALRPGGTLAFTDMVLARPFQDRREQRLVNNLGRISGLLVEDMPVKETYENLLNQHGFEQVEILDITDDVLSGFCFWFGQHFHSLSAFTRAKMWIRLRLQVWFIRWMLHREQLRYLMIITR